MKLQTPDAGRRLQLSCLNVAAREGRIDERGDGARIGKQLVQQLQSLATELGVQRGDAGEVATGLVQTGNEADLDRIGAGDEDDRNGCGCSLRRDCRLAIRGNNAYPSTNQVGR